MIRVRAGTDPSFGCGDDLRGMAGSFGRDGKPLTRRPETQMTIDECFTSVVHSAGSKVASCGIRKGLRRSMSFRQARSHVSSYARKYHPRRRLNHQPLFTSLHELLDRYPVITLGHLLDESGGQVWGLAILALAMLTFIPGVANVLSVATLLIGISMIRGVPRPWLPKTLRDMELHRGRIKDLLAKIESRIAWFAKGRGPRRAPSMSFLGFLVAWTALLAALPIPLPFANVLPAVALILFGVALLEEWSLLAWIGASISLGTTVYFAFSIWQILKVFNEILQWLLRVL